MPSTSTSSFIKSQMNPADFPGQDVYAVAGNPIAHSKSPAIHARFAQQAEQAMHYGRMQPEHDQFARAANAFFAAGGKGMNVTVPFKLDAKDFATVLTPRAERAGAVNTLWQKEGEIYGDNTDGAGLVRDLHAQGIALQGKSICLLGAGGAARGVLGPLLQEKPTSILISNRSLAKAQSLLSAFEPMALEYGVALSACPVDALLDNAITAPVDLVINATAAGLEDASPLTDAQADRLFKTGSFAYDMVYGKVTVFMRQALARGARVSDGLGMLVEQAADAFLIWRGPSLAARINARAILAELRDELHGTSS